MFAGYNVSSDLMIQKQPDSIFDKLMNHIAHISTHRSKESLNTIDSEHEDHQHRHSGHRYHRKAIRPPGSARGSMLSIDKIGLEHGKDQRMRTSSFTGSKTLHPPYSYTAVMEEDDQQLAAVKQPQEQQQQQLQTDIQRHDAERNQLQQQQQQQQPQHPPPPLPQQPQPYPPHANTMGPPPLPQRRQQPPTPYQQQPQQGQPPLYYPPQPLPQNQYTQYSQQSQPQQQQQQQQQQVPYQQVLQEAPLQPQAAPQDQPQDQETPVDEADDLGLVLRELKRDTIGDALMSVALGLKSEGPGSRRPPLQSQARIISPSPAGSPPPTPPTPTHSPLKDYRSTHLSMRSKTPSPEIVSPVDLYPPLLVSLGGGQSPTLPSTAIRGPGHTTTTMGPPLGPPPTHHALSPVPATTGKRKLPATPTKPTGFSLSTNVSPNSNNLANNNNNTNLNNHNQPPAGGYESPTKYSFPKLNTSPTKPRPSSPGSLELIDTTITDVADSPPKVPVPPHSATIATTTVLNNESLVGRAAPSLPPRAVPYIDNRVYEQPQYHHPLDHHMAHHTLQQPHYQQPHLRQQPPHLAHQQQPILPNGNPPTLVMRGSSLAVHSDSEEEEDWC